MYHSAAGDAIDDGESEDQHIATTALEQAVCVIDSGLITLDTKMVVFFVNSTNQPRIVRLFPKPSCSCPAQMQCYHMQAARMAVFLHEEYNR